MLSCELREERALNTLAAIAGSEADQSSEMTPLGLAPGAHHRDMRILATEIDPSLPGHSRDAHICPTDPAQVRTYDHLQCVAKTAPPPVARLDASALVQSRRPHRMAPLPMCYRFTVNLCRSLLLYLASHARDRLLARFVNALAQGGWLIPGHAERFSGPAADQFAARDRTAFQHLGV